MTNHIPPEKLLPQDMVDIFDHGPTDEQYEHPVIMRMHAVDAKHAMAVEPERYALEPRSASEFGGESAAESDVEPPEQTGADGPAWYPPLGEQSESEKGSG